MHETVRIPPHHGALARAAPAARRAPLRVLMIDDDDIVLEAIELFLEESFPDAEITAYPTLERGRPGADFDWSRFDVLLLDYNLGGGETGVDWLGSYGSLPGFPRTVMITAVTDPYVVANALKAGAEGYLNKTDLSPERLARVVEDVLDGGAGEPTKTRTLTRRRPAPADRPPRLEHEAREMGAGGGPAYRFGARIGQGGMATIYIAERVSDRATVVIKVLGSEWLADEEAIERFQLEGELVRGLASPHVVRVYEQSWTERYAYIVMEFFGRGDLKQRIRHGIEQDVAVSFLDEIACGLEAIHGVGIVHRDLKPANVMLRSDGSLALCDFGIAKQLALDLDLTLAGSVLGTPSYMSPEQAEGARPTPSFDLYSAGVLFYEMLTGEKPYLGESVSAVVFQHKYAAIPTLRGELARYQGILERLMAKDPADRYQSATELRAALGAYLPSERTSDDGAAHEPGAATELMR